MQPNDLKFRALCKNIWSEVPSNAHYREEIHAHRLKKGSLNSPQLIPVGKQGWLLAREGRAGQFVPGKSVWKAKYIGTTANFPALHNSRLFGLSKLKDVSSSEHTFPSMLFTPMNWYFQTGTKENIVTEHQLCKTKGGWLQFDLCGETQANSAPATTFIMQRPGAGVEAQIAVGSPCGGVLGRFCSLDVSGAPVQPLPSASAENVGGSAPTEQRFLSM
ncbi:hypothetical protein EK904_002872, partial [Melospiza melodia maxima]